MTTWLQLRANPQNVELDGVDRESLDALLPHLYLRRLVDARAGHRRAEAAWLAERLRADAPHLLRLIDGDEAG